MNQALNSQKTPHTSPLRASYGMSFVSILMKNDRVIKGFYCMWNKIVIIWRYLWLSMGSNVCWTNIMYRKVSNIRRTKSLNLNASRLIW